METHHPRASPPGARLNYRVVPSWSAGRRRFLRRQLASARRVCWLDARVANLHGQQLPVSPVAGGACARICVARSRPCGGATDWEAAYGARPAYTYVSPDQPCYREAGALQQAGVGDAAGSRGEGRRAVGEAAGHRLEGATVSEAGTDDRPCPGGASVGRRNGSTGAACDGRIRWGVRGRRVLAVPTIFPKKPDSGKPTPVEPEGNPHSRMHGRTLPQGARGSGSPGHDDAEL